MPPYNAKRRWQGTVRPTPFLFIFLKSQKWCLSSAPLFLSGGFPAAQGAFPALHFFQGWVFQRPRMPFQRSTFSKRRLSNCPACLSSSSLFPSGGFPAAQHAFPALHFFQAVAFQRPRAPFQRSTFTKGGLSSGLGCLSSASLFPSGYFLLP